MPKRELSEMFSPGVPAARRARRKQVRVGLLVVLVALGAVTMHVLTRDGPSFDRYLTEARQNAAIGRFPQAIERFTHAIGKRPQRADLYRLRASARMNIADYRGALADLEIAIRLDPEMAQAFYDRAVSRFQLGQGAEAVCPDLERACGLGHGWACQQQRNAGCP